MHPLSSQPGFKAPIINGNTVEIQADASSVDVYETPCSQGLLLQNDLYLVETDLRSDRPRRCELYDLRAETPSLALNVLDMRFRCNACDEYARRVKENDQYPKFVMSNEECSFKEICKMRCGCVAPPNELLAEVTLVALQTRGTHLYHQYALTLPAGTSYCVEHVLRLPTTDIRQNHNEIKVQSMSHRVQQLTLFFEGRAISQLYKVPLSMSSKGVEVRGNELYNSFDIRNDSAVDLALEWHATSTHMFHTTFPESVRYFQFIHHKTYENFSPDLFDEHKSYWLSTCMSLQYEPKSDMSSNDQTQFQELRLLTQVSTFESLMLRHDIDEDDMMSVPVLILARPNTAKTILNLRINQIDQQIAQYMGLEGGVARWRERDDLFWTRSSANRIYRNALLIIHIWNYFQHTRDYTWLESVGYPGIYKSAMFIVEFRHVDPGSSVIRFKNVQNVRGVTVDNDLFTNRVCMIALKYASTAAWKLNFKHQLIWEEYDRIETGVQDVDPSVFDAADKRLWVDVEFVHGTATYVFFWLEQVEGKTLFHRIGHRFGAKYGKYILVNTNTRLIRSQLIKTSYMIEIRAQDNSPLFSTETDTADSWDISQASSYNFQWRNNFFGITRAEVSHSFGENAFVPTPPASTIRKIPPENIDLQVALTMSTPYMTLLDYESYSGMVDTLEIALDDLAFDNSDGLGMISSKFMHLKHMQFIEQWKSIRFFTESLLNSKLSSKTVSFMLLFGMLCIEFRGSTNKFASTEETYLTECFNQGIFPPFVDKILVQNISSLPSIDIRNNLFKTSLRRFPKDKTLYVLTYLPETPGSALAYNIEINSFAMKLDTDPVYDSAHTFSPVNPVVKGRNYGAEHPLFASLTKVVSATIDAETYTLTATLYDHEYALTDPLPNALGTLSYNFDPTKGNYLSWRVSLDTFDQNRYVVVNGIVLRLEFRAIFAQLRIEAEGTTEDVDLTGATQTIVDKTLSSVSGSEVDIMTLHFFVVPNKEYLLQNHPPFSGLTVELSHDDSTVFKYTNSKAPLLDQTTPPFVSYALDLPVVTGRVDTAVYFDPTQVPASAGSVAVDAWYKVSLFEQTHELTPLSPGPEITQLASNQTQTMGTYTIRLNAGAITMSKTDGYQFERDFGSTYEHVILEINKHLSARTPRWIRGFRTHIIMGADDDLVYAIGTNVNFHRTTKIRHIVLTEVTELETLRNHITADQKIHDVQEGELGDSLKFQIRSGQNAFWWGMGTNYHNTLGVSRYDPLIVDNVLNNIRNVYNELVYLDMLNKKLSDHYHKRVLVAPLREGRNDELLIYDKIERTVEVLGGRSDKTRWTTVPLPPLLGGNTVRYVLYDNVEKALLLGTSSPS